MPPRQTGARGLETRLCQGRYSAILPYKGFPPPSIGGAAGKRPRLENGTPALSAAGVLLAQDPASHHAVRSWVAAVLCVCRLLLCVPPLRFQGARVTAVRDCICTMCVFVCVFYYCRTYYKAVRVGGGGEWRLQQDEEECTPDDSQDGAEEKRGGKRRKMASVKGPWAKEEDDVVICLVTLGQYGPKWWSLIASNLPGRECSPYIPRDLPHRSPSSSARHTDVMCCQWAHQATVQQSLVLGSTPTRVCDDVVVLMCTRACDDLFVTL